MRKVVKDGKVAVLVSPGYGSGWAYCLPKEAAFLPEMVEAVLRGANYEELKIIHDEFYPDEYDGGLYSLEVQWVPEGTHFIIDEYDGNEKILVLNEQTTWRA